VFIPFKHEVEFWVDCVSISVEAPVSDLAAIPHTFEDDSYSSKCPVLRKQTRLSDHSWLFFNECNMEVVLHCCHHLSAVDILLVFKAVYLVEFAKFFEDTLECLIRMSCHWRFPCLCNMFEGEVIRI